MDRVAAWDERTRWIITAAALGPIVLAAFVDDTTRLVAVVDLVSWAVFVVDLVVRSMLVRRYVLTGSGLFDLSIVLLTFPWYLLPGAGDTEFMALFRLARLVRLISTPTNRALGRRIAHQLGGLGIFLTVASLLSALIVMKAEPPESGFETFGDSLWWAVVTFTTVGYGDLFPVTPIGRFAGVLMMLAGLAALGSIAGVLASVLGGGSSEDRPATLEEPDDAVAAEVRRLQAQVADIEALLRQRNG